jgi:hypothetical protein
MDPEDLKYYVRTVAATDCSILVTHDPDYSPAVRRILRDRLSVEVCDAEDACAHCEQASR